MNMEIWKTHPIGIRVSNMGRVETRNKGKNYGCKLSNGYFQINYKGKHYGVHRLICEAFNDNPHNLPIVNHKDENPSNNRADNLEWCTQKYNLNYGTCQERRITSIPLPNTIKKSILQIDKNTLNIINEFENVNDIVNRYGYTKSSLYNCLNGKKLFYKNYIWRYEFKDKKMG